LTLAIPTFPTLPGLSFPVKRSPSFQTIEHKSVAGSSTAQSPQPFAIYAYDLPFEFLRADNATLEIHQLMGFYTGRIGKGLPFHFNDPDDNAVVGQVLGVGDGVATDFGFVRTIAGTALVDPIQDAIAAGLNVYINGVVQPLTVEYSVLTTTQYGTNYGIRFVAPVGAGQTITADFSYNWLCRFDQDAQEFSQFTRLNGFGLWESKSVKFSTVLQ
jgi:uncharacterized protein (TIGR02217 family)